MVQNSDQTQTPRHPDQKRLPAPKENGDSKDDDQEKKDEQDKKEDDKPKGPPFYKRPIPMLITGSLVLLAIIIGVIYWLYARQFETTDDAFIDGHVVTISPNISATVLGVHIDDNWKVKKGDLLVELDPRDFQVIVDQMQANLIGARQRGEGAKVQRDVADANVLQAKAELVVAQTNSDNAHRDYIRFTSLDDRSRSQQQLDNATAAAKSAEAQVEQAKAKVIASQASVSDADVSISTADANVKRADADLAQAKINLDYCKIWAPTDGMVTRKSVEPGAYIQKGEPLFSLVPTNVWVTANYKETQLDLMRVGQDVAIQVDAFSSHEFHGKVDSIQNGTGSKFTLLPPENATGNYVKIVQRVPVKIVFNSGELENAEVQLAPGMSVEPKVRVRN